MATGDRKKTGGRVAGTPNRVTVATRERIETSADPIGFLIGVVKGEAFSPAVDAGADSEKVYPTSDQRINAAVTLARKLTPDAKDDPVSITLPRIEKPSDAVDAMAAIVAAVASGEITPSAGQTIASVVESYRRTVETEDLARRLEALESKQ